MSQAVRGLYHTILRVWASRRGDDETAALEQDKVDEIFCMDNAVKVLARYVLGLIRPLEARRS